MAEEKLERLRALMRAEDDKKNNGSKPNSSGGDNAAYPFWDIPENSAATLRFLPDADDSNPWFWVEKLSISLPFAGVAGGDYPTDKEVIVKVPCVDMYGDTCPIIAHTKPWWRDDAKKELARKYYKKRSYIAQGFVVSSPFEEKSVPENPIRRFMLGSSLLQKIKAGLADPDMEFLPTDYMNGCDFRIRKTKKQDFNNYDTSEWARRTRALTEAEQLAISQFGLFNLKDFLGQRPDAEAIEAIKAMFFSSLNGEPYDMASFGKFYRPYGVGGNGDNNGSNNSRSDVVANRVDEIAANHAPSMTSNIVAEEMVDRADKPAVEPSDGKNPQDLLARLRQRAGNQSAV